MSEFTEESLLLIRNWEAYKDMIKAGDQLKVEFRSMMPKIKKRFREEGWWNAKWVMADPQDNPDSVQFTFCDKNDDDERLIWIGAENLTPDAFFGNSSPPYMFIWMTEKRPEIKAELQKIIKNKSDDFIGELSKSQNAFVVEKSLRKYLPEEIDRLKDMTFAQLMEDSIFMQLAEFCKYYSQYFEEFKKVELKYRKKSK